MSDGPSLTRPNVALRRAAAGLVLVSAAAPVLAGPIWPTAPARAAVETPPVSRPIGEGIALASAEAAVPPAPAPEEPERDLDHGDSPGIESQPVVPPAPPPLLPMIPDPAPSPAYPAPVHTSFAPAPSWGMAAVSYRHRRCPPTPRHGCRCEDELDHRCIYDVPAHGSALYATFGAQIAKADASQMMLYEYDFLPGGEELNLRGRYQLAKIAARAERSPFPIVVQATPAEPSLAEARRLWVLEELRAGGWPGPEERVAVGLPLSPGLHGLDAVPISIRLSNLTLSGGVPAAAGAPASTQGPVVPTVP